MGHNRHSYMARSSAIWLSFDSASDNNIGSNDNENNDDEVCNAASMMIVMMMSYEALTGLSLHWGQTSLVVCWACCPA